MSKDRVIELNGAEKIAYNAISAIVEQAQANLKTYLIETLEGKGGSRVDPWVFQPANFQFVLKNEESDAPIVATGPKPVAKPKA